ncbi:thioesterase family protein [uncultured Paraglaciecola sp.]|uniref:acyl-CoA thioesterase n=1 Tax=uncultured Paraglaciecola sp. TaxID=1765024 RepID=UPI0030D9876B|tara:strand:- start:68545 stop:68976 length:432 start_codon:yes stop_codon:yes gene_type:complete
MDGQSKRNFVFYYPITTRWMDNDMFGHVNNVNYYSYFDTVINQFLIEQGDFVPQKSQQIGFIVKSSCSYISPVSYPQKLIGALRVDKIGNSSVEYVVAIFKENQENASAVGCLTHVFVDRDTHKPTPIQGRLREAMLSAVIPT